MALPRVQEAEAYLRQVRMSGAGPGAHVIPQSKEKFEEMERELNEAVAMEASLLGSAGCARTGLGQTQPQGRLRERCEGCGADEELARRLQAEADAEVAMAFAAEEGPPSTGVTADALPSDDSDEMLARRLQSEADAETAVHHASDDAEADYFRLAAADAAALDDEVVARRLQNELDSRMADPSGWRSALGSSTSQSVQSHSAPIFGSRELQQDMRRSALGVARQSPALPIPPRPGGMRTVTPGSLLAGAVGSRMAGGDASDTLLRRVIDASASDDVGFAVPGAEPEVVASATSNIVYSSRGGGGSDQGAEQQCLICYEQFQEGEQLRVLPCFHRFHTACAERWLQQSRTCPICKHDITR